MRYATAQRNVLAISQICAGQPYELCTAVLMPVSREPKFAERLQYSKGPTQLHKPAALTVQRQIHSTHVDFV